MKKPDAGGTREAIYLDLAVGIFFSFSELSFTAEPLPFLFKNSGYLHALDRAQALTSLNPPFGCSSYA